MASVKSPWPNSPAEGSVTLLGLPWDGSSSFRRGAARAPERIRAALSCDAWNLCVESGLDLGAEPRLADAGDLRLTSGDWLDAIEAGVAGLLERGSYVLSLGGDHAVALPVLRAYARKFRPLTVLQLDAHPDLYDELGGDRFSHACPFARAMEEGLVGRLVQVGIRTMTPHQREQADRFGVEVVDMARWDEAADLRFEGPLYLSVDLDVLDPAFAPGISHREPGGASVREVLGLFNGIETPVVGADLVELNPARDEQGTSEVAAAKLVKEMAALMLRTTVRSL